MGTTRIDQRLPAEAPRSGARAAEPCSIPDHELLRCIGCGSYGEVWLAKNVMGSFRAVKVIHRRNFREDRPFEREFAGIRRFEPISRTHLGFVCILHIGRNEQGRYFYYVMEVADDALSGQNIRPENYAPKTLHGQLAERRKLSGEESLDLAVCLTSALAHLHKNGLVHRDIKPSNIIYVLGQPKLADIGLVTEIGESATFLGTEGYVAPEGPGRPSADIYSLGMLLYEASTGQSLRHFPDMPTALESEPDPRRQRLHQLIVRACQLNPAKRPASAEQMHEELVRIRDGGKGARPAPAAPVKELAVALFYQADHQPDAQLAAILRTELGRDHCRVLDTAGKAVGVQWARELENNMAQADVAIVLLSDGSAQSEMLAYEVEMARDAAQRQKGKPRLICVSVGQTSPVPSALAAVLDATPRLAWPGPEGTQALLLELSRALHSPGPSGIPAAGQNLEAIGGAVPLDSTFYVQRAADEAFEAALSKGDSIVLVKGPRQVGKTSLLARALQQARQDGVKVVFTDFQKLNASSFEALDKFYLALGESLADQLELEAFPADCWDPRRTPNHNFERFLRREILDKIGTRLVWGMDEVDRLFPCSLSGEVFGLFRSWHNERAMEPSGPWSRLTLAIAHATEAHLFLSDLAQSPFNVGTRLLLGDFSPAQISDLNARYGSPLTSPDQVDRFIRLVGGQPFLVRRGLHEFATQHITLDALESDEGVFGDHLRRLLAVLAKDAALTEVVRRILRGEGCSTAEAFYRLRSAGVMTGDSPASVRPRCELYAIFLRRHLL